MKEYFQIILAVVGLIGTLFLYAWAATKSAEHCKKVGGQFISSTHGFGCIGRPGEGK
jgi:hypothetical protein